MYNLLVFLFSLYPTVFLFNAIPAKYVSMLDNFASTGLVFFISHLIVFGIIFFIVHTVFRKFITIGFMRSSKTNIFGLSLIVLMLVAVAIIVFYQVLPGQSLYTSPKLINDFILTQPFTIIILLLPFGYLFFD